MTGNPEAATGASAGAPPRVHPSIHPQSLPGQSRPDSWAVPGRARTSGGEETHEAREGRALCGDGGVGSSVRRSPRVSTPGLALRVRGRTWRAGQRLGLQAVGLSGQGPARLQRELRHWQGWAGLSLGEAGRTARGPPLHDPPGARPTPSSPASEETAPRPMARPARGLQAGLRGGPQWMPETALRSDGAAVCSCGSALPRLRASCRQEGREAADRTRGTDRVFPRGEGQRPRDRSRAKASSQILFQAPDTLVTAVPACLAVLGALGRPGGSRNRG